MANGNASEISLEAASALALHLKRNPEEARRPAHELAQTYGLTASFVQTLLDSFAPSEVPSPPKKLDLSWARTGLRWLVGRFESMTRDAIRFVAITGVVALVLLVVLAEWSNIFGTSGSVSGISVTRTAAVALASATVILHLACYFHSKMVRYPVQGGLILWMSSSIVIMVVSWLDLQNRQAPEGSRWAQMAFASIGMFMLSLLYTGVGAAAAVLGSYTQLRRSERVREEMTRQEKLERYIQLKTRVSESTTLAPERMTIDRYAVTHAIRQHPFVWLGLAALTTSGIGLTLNSLIGPSAMLQSGASAPTASQILYLVLQTANLLVSLFLYIAAGFFARRAWRALLVCLWMYGVSFLFYFVPTPENVLAMRQPWFVHVISSVGMVSLTMMAALAGYVQRRLSREKRLQRNDRETLMAELMQLHVELATDDLEVCVMVVDAARSSEMKAANDPLVVEYTFRLYQDWIEKISVRHGGRVHSTAGDGAVVAFDTGAQALAAARSIQTDVDRFNRIENKLNKPFRLRIGLHAGTIKADLDEVVFTEVIDIAAHVEATAPVGGIAVTQRVVDQLSDEVFLPLATEVDGYTVLLVKNPTE